MNAVQLLLLQGRKKDAKQAAKWFSVFALADYAKQFKIDSVTRWRVAAYLLGWLSWKELEPDLIRCKAYRIPLS